MTPSIYLASQSPRRRQLLEQIAVSFTPLYVAIDETSAVDEDPTRYVTRMALEKAQAGWRAVVDQGLPPRPVLGADTTVVLDNQILGKPTDDADGLRMLHALSGREHQVLSAVALVFGARHEGCLCVSRVRFCRLTAAQCAAYWATGEGRDKAGAYAIQGRAAVFVEHLEGSYSGVMGLPLFELGELLRAFGVEENG